MDFGRVLDMTAKETTLISEYFYRRLIYCGSKVFCLYAVVAVSVKHNHAIDFKSFPEVMTI